MSAPMSETEPVAPLIVTGTDILIVLANALHQMDHDARLATLTSIAELVQALDNLGHENGPQLSYDHAKGEMTCSFTNEAMPPVVVPVEVPHGVMVQ